MILQRRMLLSPLSNSLSTSSTLGLLDLQLGSFSMQTVVLIQLPVLLLDFSFGDLNNAYHFASHVSFSMKHHNNRLPFDVYTVRF